METAAHIDQVLDHATKSSDFIDSTAANYYDPLNGLDYLQYPPHSPFSVSMGREYSGCPSHASPILTSNSQCPLPRPLAWASTRSTSPVV